MKIKGEKYNTMFAAVKAVIEFCGMEKFKNGVTTADIWLVWHYAWNNIQYDDSHPFFISGRWTRVFPYNADFQLYSDGDNDDHIITALKRIFRELDIVINAN